MMGPQAAIPVAGAVLTPHCRCRRFGAGCRTCIRSRLPIIWEPTRNEETETVATRLWRDRVQLREQERNEAQARLRIAEEKVAILMAENDRLAAENARLRASLQPDASSARTETELQMEALKGALLPLLSQPAMSLNS